MPAPKNIYIDRQSHDVYRRLTDGKTAPFDTMKNVFMLAAVLGFRTGQRTPLRQRQEIFQWTGLDAQIDIPTLEAIAICSTERPDVVGDLSAVAEVAQDYANAGIWLISEAIMDAPGMPANNLISLLLGKGASAD